MTTSYRFTYPDFGCKERGCHDEYQEHSGQTCVIVKELGNEDRDPEVGPMFLVRFADDVELHAHDDELKPRPKSTLLKLVRDGEDTYWDELTA